MGVHSKLLGGEGTELVKSLLYATVRGDRSCVWQICVA